MIRRRSLVLPAWLVGGLAVALFAPTLSHGAAEFVVSQGYDLRLQGEPAKISFLAAAYVVNVTEETFDDLVFTARAPQGFTISLAPRELQEVYLASPDDFQEELVDGAYRMRQTHLGPNQATLLFYQVTYPGKGEQAVFPGLEIEFQTGEGPKQFRANDETLSLAKYHRFSGSINDFVRRHAGLSFTFPVGAGSPEWTFVAPDYRTFGRGFIDVQGSPETQGQFRVQNGFPGDFREMLVLWEVKERSKKDPMTEAQVRSQLEILTRWLGDYRIEPDTVKASSMKLAKIPTIVLEGRWADNKEARLGSGPFRLYALHDPRSGKDFFIYLGAQGRGLGAEKADTPAPEQEAKLLREMAVIAETFRP